MATDRSILGLVIETKTVGQAEIDKLTGSFNKLADAVDKSGKRVSEQSDSVAQSAAKWKAAVQNPIEAATGSAERFVLSYGKVGAGIAAGAVAVAAGAALWTKWATEQGRAAEATINFSDRLGISIGRAEQLQAAFSIAGVESGALEGSVRSLSQALEDPTGAGAKAVDTLRSLGIQTRTLSGEQRELGPVLLDVLGRLSQIRSDSERVATAQRLLGRGAATEILPAIKNYKELNETVKQLGIGIDENGIKKFAEFDDKVGALTLKFELLKRKLTEPLLGPAGSLIDFLIGTGERRFIDIPGAVTRQNIGATSSQDANLVTRMLGGRSDRAPFSPDAAYSAYLNTTDRGLQLRLQQAQDDLKKAEGDIKTAVTEAQATEAVSRAKRLASTIKQIQEQIANIAKTPYKDVRATIGDVTGLREFGLAQVDPLNSQKRVASFIDRTATINTEIENLAAAFESINAEVAQTTSNEIASVSELSRRVESISDTLDKVGATDKAQLDAALRLANLSDNEYQVAQRIRDIKLEAARSTTEAREAELDYAVRIAEIEKSRLDRYKEQARGVFRSLIQGGGGIDSLFKTTGTQLFEQLFVNASGSLFKSVGGTLGRAGAASGLNNIPGLSGLLKGTLFDPANGSPIESNTLVTQQNTAATIALTRAFGGGAVGGSGSGSGGALDAIAKLPSLLGGGRASIPSSIDIRDLPLNSGLGGVKDASRFSFGRALGVGGALAAGTLGAYAGFSSGGPQGALYGSASIASTAGALLPMLSKSLAAAGPIGLIAGLGLSLIGGLLPNAKKRFEEEQTATIKGRQFTGADAMSQDYDVATTGQQISSDFKGRTRVIVQQTIQINAMDYSSIVSRKEDLAKVIGDAAREGNPDLVLGISQVAFGPGAA
jgi:hypothetical protein